MNKPKSFHEAFWGTDFCSTTGFEVLKKRLKDGRATCKTYAEYLRNRAKAEDDFSRALYKSCKLSPELTESGNTVRAAIDCLRLETEKMAGEHSELSGQLNAAAHRMNDFINRQRAEIKQLEEAVTLSIKTKVSLYKSVNDAKRQYEQKSQEADNAEAAYNRAKECQNAFTTKDYDKIVTAARKTKLDAEKAYKCYEDYCNKLEVARLEWERNMTEFCKSCELQEQARIKMLQNEMWIGANLIATCAGEVDEKCENVRQKLELVDISGDIQTFINSSGTGRDRPEPVRFEEYHSQNATSSSGYQRRPSDVTVPQPVSGHMRPPEPNPSRLPRTPVGPPVFSPEYEDVDAVAPKYRPPQGAGPQLVMVSGPPRPRQPPVQIVNRNYNQHRQH